MRDGIPNYLNMHNIDPGRVVPARIDAPPGNDSIRPGMNIGTIGVAGAGRRPAKVTMEQIEVFFRKLLNLEVDNSITFSDDLWYEIRIALSELLSLSISPWVKTADRLPTEADADELGRVLLMCVVDKWCNCVPVSTIDADEEWFWMPIPPLQGEV